jgi:hypothetical protein
MTKLKQLHDFCTKTGCYPSRLTIQGEIERLLAEEEREEKAKELCPHDKGREEYYKEKK